MGDWQAGLTGQGIEVEPLTVGMVSQYVQDLLNQDERLARLWLWAEVSSLKDSYGHLFLTLQDEAGGETLQGVVWRSQRSRLQATPKLGEQFLLLGHIGTYAQRSSYRLVVQQVLAVGEGLQARRRQQLRDRLQAEGLFDPAHKRPLPPHPHTLAVVTSPQAAAWGDIQRTLGQRHPGLRVLLSPAVVQGPQAPASIAQALARVEADGRAEVIILARGGGAREDLECFDDERVVRAIFSCALPVITGIGHEQDESLADLVADYCAHTPTAAAERAVPALAQVIAHHHQRRDRLHRALTLAVAHRRDRLHLLRRRLLALRLDQRLHQERQQLTWLRHRWATQVSHDLEAARHHCQALGQQLQDLDPAAVLRRGYALVRQENSNSLVTDAAQVTPGQSLTVHLSQGHLTVTVTATHSP